MELKLGGLTSAGGALKLPMIAVLMLRVPVKVSSISSTECSRPVSDLTKQDSMVSPNKRSAGVTSLLSFSKTVGFASANPTRQSQSYRAGC